MLEREELQVSSSMVGLELDEDSWLNWNVVKGLAALAIYMHPELKLG